MSKKIKQSTDLISQFRNFKIDINKKEEFNMSKKEMINSILIGLCGWVYLGSLK